MLTRYFRHFWLQPRPHLPLGLLRIGVAAVALFHLFYIRHEWLTLYGREGLIRSEINDALIADFLPRFSWLTEGIMYLLPFSEVTAIYTVVGGYALVLVALLLGWHTRRVAVLAWFVQLCMINSTMMLSYGFDTFLNNGLLFCWLMPVGGAYSLDNLRYGRRGLARSLLAGVSLRVIQLHLCIIYFMSGLNKMAGEQWWNGEAIWRSVMQPPLQQLDLAWLASTPWLAMVVGWSVLLFETAYPLAIWHRRSRPLWLVAIVGMHLGIGICMNLKLFAAIMIVLNISAFGWRYLLEAIRWWAKQWRTAPSMATVEAISG